MRTFVHSERAKMGRLPGKHNDHVMTLALANLAVKQGRVGAIPFV